MAALAALALQCNYTRVVTWMIDGEHNYERMGTRIANYNGPCAADDAHIISHHQGADRIAALMLMNDWHVKKFQHLCDKLDEVKEANGKSLLHNSVVMFGAGMGDGNRHGDYDVDVGKNGYDGVKKVFFSWDLLFELTPIYPIASAT